MKTVSALDYVRSNPDRFFRLKEPNGAEIAHALLGDVLFLGVPQVLFHQFGAWWVIAGSIDWIGEEVEKEVFTKIIPLPEAGDNSMRAEIIAVAFASAVITACDGVGHVVRGSVPRSDAIWENLPPEWPRVIAFQFHIEGLEMA